MTRDERERELKAATLASPRVTWLVDEFLAVHESGRLPPHNSPDDFIQAILAKEFPNEVAAPAEPA